MYTLVSNGEEDPASSRGEQGFYARFLRADYRAASAGSARGAQREIEFHPHGIVQPFGAAPFALAHAELQATDIR